MRLARVAHIATPPEQISGRVVAFVSGLSGAGTSTIAGSVAETLASRGVHVATIADSDQALLPLLAPSHAWPQSGAREIGAAQHLDQLRPSHHAIIVDCPPGVSPLLLRVAGLADDLVFVLTPAPADLIQSYGLLKRIAPRLASTRVGLIVNRASNGQAASVARRFSNCARRFLGLAPTLHGRLPLHGRLARGDATRGGGAGHQPSIAASVCLNEISARLCPAALERAAPRRLWLQFASLFL